MMKNTLSNLQNDIWLDQRSNPRSPKYNIGGFAVIDGTVNFNLFVRAFQIFTEQNDIFSFSFDEREGRLVSEFKEQDASNAIKYLEEDTLECALAKIKANFKVPFDLNSRGPLYEIWLTKISPTKSIWYSKLHRVIADEVSFQLLFNEIDRIYRQLLVDGFSNSENVQDVKKSYQHFILDEQRYRTSNRFLKDRFFWLHTYGELPLLIYPHKNFQKNHYAIEVGLSKKENNAFQEVVKEEKLGVFQLVLNTFGLVMSKYYKKNNVNFGIPFTNRKNIVKEKTFGPFGNVLPLQLNMNRTISFLKLIKETEKEFSRCYKHRKFQQTDILRELPDGVDRLYDIRLSYEKFRYPDTFAENTSSVHPIFNDSESDPITLHVIDYEEEPLRFKFEINGSYISKFEAEQLIESFKFLLANLKKILNHPLGKIGIATTDQIKEIHKISIGNQKIRSNETFLDIWNNTYVSNNKKSIAVIHKGIHVSYKELNDQALKIANFLYKKGIRKGDKLAVMIPRSEKNILCVIAIFKIGAVYVPIDTDDSNERKECILKDSTSKYILVDSYSNSIFHHMEFNVDEILEIDQKIEFDFSKELPTKEDIACIMYTSGSSGKLKGVMIDHESLYDHTLSFAEYFRLNLKDKVMQQASLSFNTSIAEIFPILAVGGTLVIGESTKDPQEFLRQCEELGATVLNVDPLVLRYLNDHISKYRLKTRILINRGDMKPYYINNLLDRLDIYNAYGPMESTVYATYYKITDKDVLIPLGTPITNKSVYILDEGNILPLGAIGEIGLSGKGLAKGYFNREALTNASFFTINDKRIYKTGDTGKWTENGQLIFYGRRKGPLSFNGYSIEAEVVERAIKNLNSYVLDCYVDSEELSTVPILTAYVVADETFVNISDLSTGLRTKLPEYMIPTHFVLIEVMPLLPNGKINVKELPRPNQKKSREVANGMVAYKKRKIASIGKELLKVDDIDVNVSFFELEKHSLLTDSFLSEKENDKDSGTSIHAEFYPLTFSQVKLWSLHQLNRFDTSDHITKAIHLKGNVSIGLLEKTMSSLIAKHEILRTVFVPIEGEPFQKTLAPYPYSLDVISLGLTRKNRERVIEEAIQKLEKKPFDFEKGPLFRVQLLKFGAQDQVLIFCKHQMIVDKWTQVILFRDFVDIYNELKRNPDFGITQPKITFKEYAHWQRDYFNGKRLEKHLNFWEKKLKGSKPFLAIPLDARRTTILTKKEGVIEHILSLDFTERLWKFSEKHNVSLFMTMLTVFKMVLGKFSGESDICVGTTVTNRMYEQFQNVLGMMTNTIVLRTILKNEGTLSELLNNVRESCLDAYSYADTPFDLVQERIGLEKNGDLRPLFQYMFNFVDAPIRNMSVLDAEIEVLKTNYHASKLDINVSVNTTYEQPDMSYGNQASKGVSISWKYNSNIFEKPTMERMLSTYLAILDILLKDTSVQFNTMNFAIGNEEESLTFNHLSSDVEQLLEETEEDTNSIDWVEKKMIPELEM